MYGESSKFGTVLQKLDSITVHSHHREEESRIQIFKNTKRAMQEQHRFLPITQILPLANGAPT